MACDNEGLNVDKFEHQLEQTREDGNAQTKENVLYTIPTHHNPTGVCLSEGRRQRLVELAQVHDVTVLSDEPYNLLTFGDVSLPQSLSLLAPDHILSFGSFSKIACPGQHYVASRFCNSITMCLPKDYGVVGSLRAKRTLSGIESMVLWSQVEG